MSYKLKVVFDTNIYISAILFGGNPRQILELAREKGIELFVSKSILLETAEKLRDKFGWEEYEIEEVIEGISKFAKVVSPKKKVNAIRDDIEDNAILECALEGSVDIIISGDKKHLLSLGKFKNIPIVSAKQLLDIIYQKEN